MLIRLKNLISHRCVVLVLLSSIIAIVNAAETDDDKDFRFISYQDLLQTSIRFTDPNVTSFSRILFDVSRNQMIVGARDALYRLSFTLDILEKSTWEANEAIVEMCKAKGASDNDCHNYVMVLQSYGNQLYACGTHAFSPQCSWRQMDSLNITKLDKGVAKCPFNPHANITTLMTENGRLFIGSPTDFSGTDPAILRADVAKEKEDNKIMRTDQYNSKWLNSPHFVGSFEAGEFVYFVFREAAVEHINCGKIIYSRIARVCKNDPGSLRFSRDHWTSFAKARLNCSLRGEYPFYFDEVQGVQYSAENGILYATFTTPENSIHGSAICAFNLTAINAAFSGPFKHQEKSTSAWEPLDFQRKESKYNDPYECKFNTLPSSRRDLIGSTLYQLMDEAIQPITEQPLYVSKLERFTHITLDSIATKYDQRVLIMYVATEDNLVKKLSVLAQTKETCLIEIWQPEMDLNAKILNMQFLKHTESLYIGSENSIIRIPAQHCGRHLSQASCENAMDPYCGWSELNEACISAPGGDPLKHRYWKQKANECPFSNVQIDGGLSAWSDWHTCSHHSDDNRFETSNQDTCLCRTRSCNNPAPRNGGKACDGPTMSVTNCTVHGKWTDWGPWTVCSSTCGMGIRSRRRTCGNPAPAHNGRTCVGQDRQEMYCTNLPPCPAKKHTIDGSWGAWDAFSECSASCGSGFRLRTRKCDDPAPLNGGADCNGSNIDYEICNTQPCPEIQKLSQWTPWLQNSSNTTSNGEYLEKRFRFMCKSNGSDPNSLKIFKAKEENRLCSIDDGSCHRVGENNDLGFGDWSSWTSCTASCGGGQQYRTRMCERDNCDGTMKMARACNTQPCKGEWTCWSDWTQCSVTCGIGKRTRSRTCMAANELDGNSCEGPSIEYETCEMPTCDSFNGWSFWSEWSDCNEDGERSRQRKCLKTDPEPNECQGNERDIRSCSPHALPEVVTAAGSASTYILLLLIAVLCCSNGFLYIYMKRQNGAPRDIKNAMGSPCYDSYPNQYSSLPTKEDRPKVKRQSSFSAGALNSNGAHTKLLANGHGTLTKTNNMSGHHMPKVLSKSFVEVDTATIKRNSHGLNNARPLRTLDDDKF